MDNPEREKKHSKALSVGHWILMHAAAKAPKNAPSAAMVCMNTVAIVTDVLRLTCYHLMPVYDGSGYSLVVKEQGREVPRNYDTFFRLFSVTEMILAYKNLSSRMKSGTSRDRTLFSSNGRLRNGRYVYTAGICRVSPTIMTARIPKMLVCVIWVSE